MLPRRHRKQYRPRRHPRARAAALTQTRPPRPLALPTPGSTEGGATREERPRAATAAIDAVPLSEKGNLYT